MGGSLIQPPGETFYGQRMNMLGLTTALHQLDEAGMVTAITVLQMGYLRARGEGYRAAGWQSQKQTHNGCSQPYRTPAKPLCLDPVRGSGWGTGKVPARLNE